MTATAIIQRRISGFSVLFAIALLLAGVAVFVWNQSDNPFKTWILVGVLSMLFCVSVVPFLFGPAHAFILFMFSSAFVVGSIQADYYTSPLSGVQIAELSLSECMKDRVEYRIKNKGPINREDMMHVKDMCDFVAKTKTVSYQAEQKRDAEQRKKAEDDQLSALGASRK